MVRSTDGQESSPWRRGTVLARLSPSVRAELIRLGAFRSYDAGNVLIEEGADNRQAILLLSGYVKVTTAAGDGSVLLTIRAQGDLVGDLAALSGEPRSATVMACTSIAARVIPADALQEFAARYREAGELINASIVQQLSNANRRRVEFATKPVAQRLARVILELSAVCGEQLPTGHVRLPGWFRQADLADLVGVSEDSVQRALRELRGLRVIDTGYRSLTVLDPDRLAAMCERQPRAGRRGQPPGPGLS